MRKRAKIVIFTAAVAVLFVAAFSLADEYSEREEHHERVDDKHHGKKRKHGSSDNTQFTENSVYISACGGCHWAYVPALLPSKSWENILATLSGHFGSEVQLTGQQQNEVTSYLLSNASDKSSLKIGRKITQSLGATIPERITDVPYIIRKHHKIDQETFSSKSVKSLSNCIACHPSASSAKFDDDDVTIPKK